MAHSTTMNSTQRNMLVDCMTLSYGIERVARLTDVQLYEQWLFDCQYNGGKKHIEQLED